MTTKLTPAVFLDRDGTIIEDRGHLRSPSEVVFFPDTVPALARLQEHFRLFIVTNQSGIAKGIVGADEVARVNDFVVAELRRHGIVVSAVYCCPHNREDGCVCVKPKPHFLQQAADAYDLDLRRSFAVGDHPHDVQFAENAGATGIYVLTGHGAKHRAELPAGRAVVPGIREAAEWILAAHAMKRQEAEHPGLRDRAAGILRNGGIVAFPTETVSGLGAVAFDEQAVARVFEAKQRPSFDPLIVHVSSPEQLPQLVETIPRTAEALMERFWPGPLTLVLPKRRAVPDLVTAGLPTVAVRMPRHPLALDLIERTGLPVAAPSANPFGYVSPTRAEHVLRHLGSRVDLVLDGGPCTVGLESTVLSLVGSRPAILRAGGIPCEDIEQVIGVPVRTAPSSGPVCSPGQTPSHYSPRTPIVSISGRRTMRARLAFVALEDGTILRGHSIGAPVDALGEVVFNTGMTGYREILSDPSYHGQIVTMTYPEIGNTGANAFDMESRRGFANGLIVRESNPASNWRADELLDAFLLRHGIPAIAGVDTRALTSNLRDSGTLKGYLAVSGDVTENDAVEKARGWGGLDGQDYASRVTCDKAYGWTSLDPSIWAPGDGEAPPVADLSIVAYDFGIKWNILRSLRCSGMDVTVVPAKTPAVDVMAMKPDGVFFSNGPADPAAVTYAIDAARALLGKVPLMGICLGHQILATATGGKTCRLKFGHHGCNHPVKDLATGKVEITSQNHNFAVEVDSLDPAVVAVTHVNLNDGTVEGIRHVSEPMFAVQYHPEACPGPRDPSHLFMRFRKLIEQGVPS